MMHVDVARDLHVSISLNGLSRDWPLCLVYY